MDFREGLKILQEYCCEVSCHTCKLVGEHKECIWVGANPSEWDIDRVEKEALALAKEKHLEELEGAK